MPTSSLFRADDFLIRAALHIGAVVVVVVPVVTLAVVNDGWVVSPAAVLGLAALTIAPITMLVVGLRLRRRENRAIALWKIIDRDVEISAHDLQRDSDWTAPHLDRAIRDLNNAGAAFVVWDRNSDVIQNGRLRRTTQIVDECTACSGKLSVQVTIGSSAAVLCPYCHEPIDVARVAEEKARLIDELETDRPGLGMPGAVEEADPGEFNAAIFVLLFVVFWPGAVWYCLEHRTRLADLIG